MSKGLIDAIYTPWNEERKLKPFECCSSLKKNTRANHSENHRPSNQKKKENKEGNNKRGVKKEYMGILYKKCITYFPSTTPAPRNKTSVSPFFTFPAPMIFENSKKSPAST